MATFQGSDELHIAGNSESEVCSPLSSSLSRELEHPNKKHTSEENLRAQMDGRLPSPRAPPMMEAVEKVVVSNGATFPGTQGKAQGCHGACN